MSFLNKVELKRQLKEMGVKVEGNYVGKKDIERVIATGFDDLDKQNYDDYHSLIERLDDVIEILERAKPEKWSIARRHDVREYIDKHFKAANKKFWDKVGKLSSTLDPTDRGSTAPYEVKDRPYKY